MPKRGNKESDEPPRRPAVTLEGRENQLISMAVDQAEKQIRNGTASSQVLTHFLKLGTTRELLEQERLRQENDLLRAKVKAQGNQQEIKALYEEALLAMRTYAGHDVPQVDDYED